VLGLRPSYKILDPLVLFLEKNRDHITSWASPDFCGHRHRLIFRFISEASESPDLPVADANLSLSSTESLLRERVFDQFWIFVVVNLKDSPSESEMYNPKSDTSKIALHKQPLPPPTRAFPNGAVAGL